MASENTYDPFVRGRFPVGVRTFECYDSTRKRQFPYELWYPASATYAGQDLSLETQDVFQGSGSHNRRTQNAVRNAAAHAGNYPLVVFSHGTAADGRRMATYLTTHVASHGYLVAARDHSETVASELARRMGETAAEKAARVDAWISNRVPDIRFF